MKQNELLDPSFEVTAERNDKPIELEEDDRDMETGVPMKGKKHKDINLGLTEFPEGRTRKKDSEEFPEKGGYGLPFAEMDNNFQRDRTIDPNIRFLPIERQTLDIINRMFNDGKDYDARDMYGKERAEIDAMIDGGHGKVDTKKNKKEAKLDQIDRGKILAIVGMYTDLMQAAIAKHVTLASEDVDETINKVAVTVNTSPAIVRKVIAAVREAQAPTTQKSWPSTYQEDMPAFAPEAPLEIQQAYSEIQTIKQRIAEIDETVNAMKKVAEDEIKTYKGETDYDKLVKDTTTKWSTVKSLLRAVAGGVVKLGSQVLLLIEKKERSAYPNPTKFKEALIASLPELKDKIEDIYQKARSYEPVSKFYQVTEPPKQLMEGRPPTQSVLIDTSAADPFDELTEDLQDVLGTINALLGAA